MWLLPIFFTVAVTEGDSVQIQGKGLKASCLEIYTENLNIQSGSYVVANGGRNLSVYCDFREGNGFTFISRLNDVESSPIDIDKLANVKNRALIRACMPNYSQKDSLLFQLDEFKYINLSFQYNAANGYQEPDKNNEDMGPYIYLGFLPEVEADKKGTMQGYKAEGRNFRFVNCDGNGNSYFAFYFNPNSAMFGRTGNVDDIMIDWLQVAQHTMENNYLPNDFFFPFEIHMGGCGGFSTNASSIGVLGAALGLPFDILCNYPPDVPNAKVFGFPTAIGNNVTYECNTGYRLVNGDTRLRCEGTGTYSGVYPVCNKTVNQSDDLPIFKDKETECYCPCSLLKKQETANMTAKDRETYMQRRIKEIQADMGIFRKNISSVIRQKISASDSRISAQGFGYLGIVILISVFGTMLFMDITVLRRDFRIMLHNICSSHTRSS